MWWGDRAVTAAEGSGQHHPLGVEVGQRGGRNTILLELKEFFWLPLNCCPGFDGGKMKDLQQDAGGGEPRGVGC